jgi:hypothetical protein
VEHATKDLCDGYGLWLQCSPTYKTRSWLLRFMIDGKADSKGLGPLNTTSLAKAREKTQQARNLLGEGINPRAARDAGRRQRKVEKAKAITFKQCADKYIEATLPSWKNDNHARQWYATFNETRRGGKVFPAATQLINDLPVDAPDTGLVLKVLEPLWTRRRRRPAASAGASRPCSIGPRCASFAPGRIRRAGRVTSTRSCPGAPS